MALDTKILTSYKPIDVEAVDKVLNAEIAANNKKIVVLDDDPTGVQTVHDITVYTGWDKTATLLHQHKLTASLLIPEGYFMMALPVGGVLQKESICREKDRRDGYVV